MYTAERIQEDIYGLRGMNMVMPDQVIVADEKNVGRVPLAYNCRMYPRNTSGRARVPIESRDGIKYYFAPVGEAVSTQQTSVTGATDQAIGLTAWLAQSFSAGSTGALSKIELNLKKNTSDDVVVVEIREDNSGTPSETILATSAVPNRDVADSGASYVAFRFPNAPMLTSGTTYWIIVRLQEKYFITQTYQVTRTSSSSGTLKTGVAVYATNTPTATVTWSATTGSINFKTYISTAGQVLGSHRRVSITGKKETLFVQGTTLYVVDESTKTTTALKTGLSASAKYYRWVQVNDITYIVNGYDNMQKYDGSTVTSVTLPFIPDNIVEFKNRLFWTTKADPNRVFFGNLATDYETVESTNFFYVPDPKSADPIRAMAVFQDQLVIFTAETKHILAGSDISSFTRRQAMGTKGARSQEGVVVDHNGIYFLADDNKVYFFNGSSDYYISEPIQPELDYNTDPAATHLIIWERQLRIYFKSTGSPYHNRMALYYLTYREWFIDTDTYTCYPIVLDKDSNELLEFSSVIGTGYYAEQTPGAHLGAPIDWKYWTVYYKYSSGMAKDRIKKFRPYFESPEQYTTVQVGRDVDYKDEPKMRDHRLDPSTTRYDEGLLYDNDVEYKTPKIVDKAVSMPGRGKINQYRFEKNGAYTKVRLIGFGLIRTSARAR